MGAHSEAIFLVPPKQATFSPAHGDDFSRRAQARGELLVPILQLADSTLRWHRAHEQADCTQGREAAELESERRKPWPRIANAAEEMPRALQMC